MLNIINCSSEKYSLLSVYHAKIKMHGRYDTLYNHFLYVQRIKKNEEIEHSNLLNHSNFFIINGAELDNKYFKDFIKLAWLKYFINNKKALSLILENHHFVHSKEEPFAELKIEVIEKIKKKKSRSIIDSSLEFIEIVKTNGFNEETFEPFFKNKDDILINLVGCHGKMNDFLSSMIKEKYINFFRSYYVYCKQPNFSRYIIESVKIYETYDNLTIANLFVSENDISNLELLKLKNALIKLKELVQEKRIYIPYKFGSNISDEKWNKGKQIIKEIFKENYIIQSRRKGE